MNFENRYSRIEQLLHRIAFSTGGLQVSIADLEDRLHSKQLQEVPVQRPVFITALPRAGTTLLLNLLAKTGEFATHTYQDMPFLLCPMLWKSFASRFYIKDTERERAHGDGLMISQESPEALEELIWQLFWRNHYKKDRIIPWNNEMNEEFSEFFKMHIRKIITIRSDRNENKLRYLSKNNTSISRLSTLPEILPDCTIIVPFRNPLQHATSLLNQHSRFLELHEKDGFAMYYMRSIGHHDFGKNLLPINFDNWLNHNDPMEPTGVSFWLRYWIATYNHVLNTHNNAHLVSFDGLAENAELNLDKLASITGIKTRKYLIGQSAILRTPHHHDVDISETEQDLVDEANDLYEKLQRLSAE